MFFFSEFAGFGCFVPAEAFFFEMFFGDFVLEIAVKFLFGLLAATRFPAPGDAQRHGQDECEPGDLASHDDRAVAFFCHLIDSRPVEGTHLMQ